MVSANIRKGDNSKCLVHHGHFSKDIHIESNRQEKAYIRERVFQEREQKRL